MNKEQIMEKMLAKFPKMSVNTSENILPGIMLGTHYKSHADALKGLEEFGYDGTEDITGEDGESFVIEKEEENSPLDVCMSFDYEDGILAGVEVVIGKDPQEGQDPGEVVDEFRKLLETVLGTATIVLDKKANISTGSMDSSSPEIFFSMYWSSRMTGRKTSNQANEASDLLDAIKSLGHDGALCTMSAMQGSVVALIMFFKGNSSKTASTLMSGSFLSK